MGTTHQAAHDLNEVLRELIGARDEARLRAHLLGMDARRRLADIETEIDAFERKLSARGRGEWIAEHVVATARGLTRAVSELIGSRPEQEPTRVRDLMQRSPVSCHPQDSLSVAAERMREGDFGALPVVDESDKPIGVLTDRDVCMAALARGGSLGEHEVGAAMSHPVVTCKPTDTLRALMDSMATHQLRRLPVIDENGKLLGIVSLADVARLAQAAGLSSHEARVWVPGVLAGISEPARPRSPSPARTAS
jgi:CBS domain-containing protein